MTEPDYVTRLEAIRRLGISVSTADRYFGSEKGIYRHLCRYPLAHPKAAFFNVMVPVSLINDLIEHRKRV